MARLVYLSDGHCEARCIYSERYIVVLPAIDLRFLVEFLRECPCKSLLSLIKRIIRRFENDAELPPETYEIVRGLLCDLCKPTPIVKQFLVELYELPRGLYLAHISEAVADVDWDYVGYYYEPTCYIIVEPDDINMSHDLIARYALYHYLHIAGYSHSLPASVYNTCEIVTTLRKVLEKARSCIAEAHTG